MRAGWRWLFARMYKCGGRVARVPPGGVKESNKREPGELQGPLAARRNSRDPFPPGSSLNRGFLSDKIPTTPGYYRQRLSALFPRSLFVFCGRRTSGGRGRKRSRGCPAEGRENGDNSRWSRRLRSFRALTRLIANPWKRALRSVAESVHFKRHRAGHARFRLLLPLWLLPRRI